MLIEMDKIETTVIPHMRGGEKELSVKTFQDPLCKIMQGTLIPGASIGLHTHTGNSEVYYILSGSGKVLCDGVYEPVTAGSCHYCPMGHAHSLINDGEDNLVFFAVIPEHGQS